MYINKSSFHLPTTKGFVSTLLACLGTYVSRQEGVSSVIPSRSMLLHTSTKHSANIMTIHTYYIVYVGLFYCGILVTFVLKGNQFMKPPF